MSTNLLSDEDLVRSRDAYVQAGGYDNAVSAFNELIERRAASKSPIPMVLHCPKCGLQHIDAPEQDTRDELLGDETYWLNPPHRSHLCGGCGHIWRPADVSTEGVKAVQTTGKADSPIFSAPINGIGWVSTILFVTSENRPPGALVTLGFNCLADAVLAHDAIYKMLPFPPAERDR